MNYQDLTSEQKESITKELKEMFEHKIRLEEIGTLTKGYACGEDFEYYKFSSENQELFYEKTISEIKGYQEGLKVAIKQIDEESEFLEGKINVKEMTIDATSLSINIVANSYDEYAHKCFDYEPIIKMIKSRIDALKAKRDKLQFEVELQ